MYDLMFKATDKAAWDAFAETLPAADILIDEIGPIVITPAALDEQGDVVTPAVIDPAHHVNLRVLRPLTTYTDPDGNVHSDGVDCAALAQGYHYVQWIDPALVESPARIWAGGMNYWLPESVG